jgi:hypothetical protein
MCEVVAKQMLATVKSCKLYDKARTEFERHAARHDCEGMWSYFDGILKRFPEIDRGMRQDGLKPLASVRADMDRLYQQHKQTTTRR